MGAARIKFRKDADGSLHACGFGIYRWRNVALARHQFAVIPEANDVLSRDRDRLSFDTISQAKHNLEERCNRVRGK